MTEYRVLHGNLPWVTVTSIVFSKTFVFFIINPIEAIIHPSYKMKKFGWRFGITACCMILFLGVVYLTTLLVVNDPITFMKDAFPWLVELIN